MITKERLLFILGIWVAILPFVGFPNTIRKILFILTGIWLIYISYGFRREKSQTSTPSFVDNIDIKNNE